MKGRYDGSVKKSDILRFLATAPVHFERDQVWAAKTVSVAADRYTLVSPNLMTVNINDTGYVLGSQIELDLSLEATWDQVVTDYRVAATRAGKDFYIYVCVPASGSTPDILISANATYPDGYSADNSRKVGGFHGMWADMLLLPETDPLYGYKIGDIYYSSVWDLKHCPHEAPPEGMCYEEYTGLWCDIYLASGDGSGCTSVFGATIRDNKDWNWFVEMGRQQHKRLATDAEFQNLAYGIEEEVNIAGSADPVTVTAAISTTGRSMVSRGGLGLAGIMYQWLETPSARLDAGTAAGWYNLPEGKGSYYTYGTNKYGNTQLRAGGGWGVALVCGSRCRLADGVRWKADSAVGGRFVARARNT